MADSNLEQMMTILTGARTPEEIFGQLTGTREEMLVAARRTFRLLAKEAHPDRYQGTVAFAQANATFQRLNAFWEQAQARIEAGVYGSVDAADLGASRTLQSPQALYTLERLLTRGDLCNLYLARTTRAGKPIQVLLKIPRRPGDNDLLANEAYILKHLQADPAHESLGHFVSRLRETFVYQEADSGALRQVNVLDYPEGFYTLQEVRQAYARGIEVRDMAWIWRRLLVAIGYAHMRNVIHGCVLPMHVLLHPGEHGLILIDWCYALLEPARDQTHISALNSAYRDWYPAEVFAREVPTPALDIAMAARCMIELLGGDPRTGTIPAGIPWQVQQHLQACTLPTARQRPQDVQTLLAAFDELIARLWGPRTFREFRMPPA